MHSPAFTHSGWTFPGLKLHSLLPPPGGEARVCCLTNNVVWFTSLCPSIRNGGSS